MQTQSQLRAAVYTGLYNNTTLTNNIFWLGRPTVSNSFPCIVYSIIDSLGDYSFCGKQSEVVQFQIDLYTDPQDVATMDTQIETIKTVMEGLGYRNIGTPAEFLDAEIAKVIRASRWEIINV